MVKVLAIANQKGGVGKSTLCIQAAFYLTLKLGKKVLVIDMDGQGNTTSRLAPRETYDDGSFEPILSGTKTSELFEDELDAIEVLKCPAGMDLIHTPKNDADLFEREAIPLYLAQNPGKNLAKLMLQYDYVLIDCPPSLGRTLIAALLMATHVVCPIKLSGFAVDGVEGLLRTIIGIKEGYNSKLEIAGIIINDMDRSVSHLNALRVLELSVPELMFENKIMHRSPLDAATTEGVPIWTLRYGHVATKEVESTLKELLRKVG